jgi:hypothetical protein
MTVERCPTCKQIIHKPPTKEEFEEWLDIDVDIDDL